MIQLSELLNFKQASREQISLPMLTSKLVETKSSTLLLNGCLDEGNLLSWNARLGLDLVTKALKKDRPHNLMEQRLTLRWCASMTQLSETSVLHLLEKNPELLIEHLRRSMR